MVDQGGLLHVEARGRSAQRFTVAAIKQDRFEKRSPLQGLDSHSSRRLRYVFAETYHQGE
jgi:hypothetical protein